MTNTQNAKFAVELRKIDDIRPYEKNPRINDKAVDAVATSLKEFGLPLYPPWFGVQIRYLRGTSSIATTISPESCSGSPTHASHRSPLQA